MRLHFLPLSSEFIRGTDSDRLPSPAPPPPVDAPPPVTSAIPETCWDLVLASQMPAISITPPVDSPDMETQLEGDGMHVD